MCHVETWTGPWDKGGREGKPGEIQREAWGSMNSDDQGQVFKLDKNILGLCLFVCFGGFYFCC